MAWERSNSRKLTRPYTGGSTPGKAQAKTGPRHGIDQTSDVNSSATQNSGLAHDRRAIDQSLRPFKPMLISPHRSAPPSRPAGRPSGPRTARRSVRRAIISESASRSGIDRVALGDLALPQTVGDLQDSQPLQTEISAAHEVPHEFVRRSFQNIQWLAELDEPALVHDGDRTREPQRFVDIGGLQK